MKVTSTSASANTNSIANVRQEAFDIADQVISNVPMLFAWLVDNNAASVNNVLKNKLGITSLPFKPDLTQIRAQVDMLIQKSDKKGLQTIIDNFKFNPDAGNYTIDPELVLAIQTRLKK